MIQKRGITSTFGTRSTTEFVSGFIASVFTMLTTRQWLTSLLLDLESDQLPYQRIKLGLPGDYDNGLVSKFRIDE